MTGVTGLRRVLVLPLLWLIRGYQLVISPLTPPSCRYYPSCSAYAVTALGRHGLVRGGWLALRRIGRCHPWSEGGVDHVPPLPGQAPDDHRLPEDRDPGTIGGPGTSDEGSSAPGLATETIPHAHHGDHSGEEPAASGDHSPTRPPARPSRPTVAS